MESDDQGNRLAGGMYRVNGFTHIRSYHTLTQTIFTAVREARELLPPRINDLERQLEIAGPTIFRIPS